MSNLGLSVTIFSWRICKKMCPTIKVTRSFSFSVFFVRSQNCNRMRMVLISTKFVVATASSLNACPRGRRPSFRCMPTCQKTLLLFCLRCATLFGSKNFLIEKFVQKFRFSVLKVPTAEETRRLILLKTFKNRMGLYMLISICFIKNSLC